METSRLILTRLTNEHLEGFHRIWSDKEATQWSSHGICKTLEDSREWMSGILVETNPDVEVYAIFLKADNKSSHDKDDSPQNETMIGIIGTHKTDPVPELSYTLHPSVWGKGYATEALQKYTQCIFQLKPQWDRLTAWVDTENAGSINVLKKCGFVQEQVEKGGYVIPWKTPTERDSLLFVFKCSIY